MLFPALLGPTQAICTLHLQPSAHLAPQVGTAWLALHHSQASVQLGTFALRAKALPPHPAHSTIWTTHQLNPVLAPWATIARSGQASQSLVTPEHINLRQVNSLVCLVINTDTVQLQAFQLLGKFAMMVMCASQRLFSHSHLTT